MSSCLKFVKECGFSLPGPFWIEEMASRQCWCWSRCINKNYLWRYSSSISRFFYPYTSFLSISLILRVYKLLTKHHNKVNVKPSRVILLWLRRIAWVWMVFLAVFSTFYHKSVVCIDFWVTWLVRIWNILISKTPIYVIQEHTGTNFSWLGCFKFWSETLNKGAPSALLLNSSTWKMEIRRQLS